MSGGAPGEGEKLELLKEKPLFCSYHKRFGIWRVHMPDKTVIIHDAKHYLEARLLEDIYREMGRKAYRLNLDVVEDEKIARELLARCPRIFRYRL